MVLIPYIGSIVLFVIMLLPGTQGPNDYGRTPRIRMGRRNSATSSADEPLAMPGRFV